MEVSSGDHELAAIKIPLDATPKDVAVQVDIIPNPPAGADPSAFVYGVGCRLNKPGKDFYFLGVSPVPGVDGFFMATFMQFKGGKLDDYELFPTSLRVSQNGVGYTAAFRCAESRFLILDGKRIIASVTNSDFQEGDLFLGIYRLAGTAGNVKFDNLTVSEVH